MKSLLIIICSFTAGLSLTWLYLNSVESDERMVNSLKSVELSQAFSKISQIHNIDDSTISEAEPKHVLAGVVLSASDMALLDKYKKLPKHRELAQAILLGAYAEGLTEDDYLQRMEEFKSSLSSSPNENFQAALELRDDPDLQKNPLRKASIYMILTSIPGKEKEGMELAISESRTNVDVNELNELGLSVDEKYDHMLLPVLAFEAALGKMKEQGSDAFSETIKTLETQSNVDIRKGILEKFETAYPDLKGKIKI